jgi:general secretion pathway protein K
MRKEGLLGRGAGTALVVGLWLLAILSLSSLGMAYQVRLGARSSSMSRKRQEALYLCKAMTARATAALERDLNEYDARNEAWAAHHPFIEEGWLEDLGLDEKAWGRVEYSVRDESGKINVNVVGERYLWNLAILEPAWTSAILDWVDADDVPRPGGAESEYYARLTPPRLPRNAAVMALDELLAVKGMTPEFFLNGVEDLVEAPPEAADGSGDPAGAFETGPRSVLTVYGDSGLININTARPEVLAAISPSLSEETVRGIAERVRGPDGLLGGSDDEPFESLDDLVTIYGITDLELALLRAACTVRSTVFSIHCRASSLDGSVTKTTHAVVERDAASGAARTLAWREY